MIAIPLAGVLQVDPIGAGLLSLNGTLGLAGWQWLFLIEGLPAIALGFIAFAYLPDRPTDAHWLAPAGRDWLVGRLAAERRQREATAEP